MRKFLTGLIAGLLSLSAFAQDPYPELGAKLQEYFTALAGESASAQVKECDFLIESCKDSLVRQYVTLKIYDHYLRSKIMGDDAVAVHVADKWLLSGLVPMHSEEDLRNADIYATFNRRSLIGCKAPVFYTGETRVPATGKYSVIYFYSAGCSTCKVETAALDELVASGEYPFELFRIDVDKTSGDWQMDYGVLKTPWMFLVNPSGEIIGRGLDTEALRMLLRREFASGHYEYGSPVQTARFRQMFDAYGTSIKASDVADVAAYLAARTFGEGDIEAFKQVEGDLLYYIAGRREEAYKDAIIPFVETYLDLPDVWTTAADSSQVVAFGKFLASLTSRTPVGTLVPDLTAPGTLRRKGCLFAKGSREGTFAFRGLKGRPGYVVFFTGGCSSCRETLDKVDALVSGNPKARVLLVDMDALMSSSPDLATVLLETFDLSSMPMVLELDRKGVITHRYVQL